MDKLIFLHMPKCGGRSIMTLFDQNYENKCVYNNMRLRKIFNAEFLSQYDLIEGHINYEHIKGMKEYKKICIFRDPLQRTISQFNHFKTMETSIPIAKQMKEEDWSFFDFVTSMIANVAKWVNVYCQFLGDDMGEVLNPLANFHWAKKRLMELDFVGIFEEMDLTVKYLKKRFDLKGEVTVKGITPQQNKCRIELESIPTANWWLMPDTIIYQMARERFYKEGGNYA